MIFDKILFPELEKDRLYLEKIERELISLFERYKKVWNELAGLLSGQQLMTKLYKSIQVDRIDECLEEINEANMHVDAKVLEMRKTIKIDTFLVCGKFKLSELKESLITYILNSLTRICITVGADISILGITLLIYKDIQLDSKYIVSMKEEVRELRESFMEKIVNTDILDKKLSDDIIKKNMEIYKKYLQEIRMKNMNKGKLISNVHFKNTRDIMKKIIKQSFSRYSDMIYQYSMEIGEKKRELLKNREKWQRINTKKIKLSEDSEYDIRVVENLDNNEKNIEYIMDNISEKNNMSEYEGNIEELDWLDNGDVFIERNKLSQDEIMKIYKEDEIIGDMLEANDFIIENGKITTIKCGDVKILNDKILNMEMKKIKLFKLNQEILEGENNISTIKKSIDEEVKIIVENANKKSNLRIFGERIGIGISVIIITMLIYGITEYFEGNQKNKKIKKDIKEVENILLELKSVIEKEIINIKECTQSIQDGIIKIDKNKFIIKQGMEKAKIYKIID
ncbi:MAG: hypothetical protein ACRCSG_00860 [Cellulosilyticaceae bacterium]